MSEETKKRFNIVLRRPGKKVQKEINVYNKKGASN